MKKQNKRKTNKQLSPEMVKKTVRSVRKSEGDYGRKDLWKR